MYFSLFARAALPGASLQAETECNRKSLAATRKTEKQTSWCGSESEGEEKGRRDGHIKRMKGEKVNGDGM